MFTIIYYCATVLLSLDLEKRGVEFEDETEGVRKARAEKSKRLLHRVMETK